MHSTLKFYVTCSGKRLYLPLTSRVIRPMVPFDSRGAPLYNVSILVLCQELACFKQSHRCSRTTSRAPYKLRIHDIFVNEQQSVAVLTICHIPRWEPWDGWAAVAPLAFGWTKRWYSRHVLCEHTLPILLLSILIKYFPGITLLPRKSSRRRSLLCIVAIPSYPSDNLAEYVALSISCMSCIPDTDVQTML